MEMFYKGYRFTIETTDIIGGVCVTYEGSKRTVARRGVFEGRAFSDLYAIKDELKILIDIGQFESIEQLPEFV